MALMRTSNPALNAKTFADVRRDPSAPAMTLEGTVNKAAFQQSALSSLLKPWKLPYWIAALAVLYESTAIAVNYAQTHRAFSVGRFLGIGSLVWIAAIVVPIVIYKAMTSARVQQFMSAINYQELVTSAP